MASKRSEAQNSVAAAAMAQMTFRKVAAKNQRVLKVPVGPKALVEPGGRVRFNGPASDDMKELALSQNLVPGRFLLELAASDNGYAAMKPVPLGTDLAAKVTVYKDGTLGVQIRELFDEVPDMRPAVRQLCVPFVTKNQDGETCMVIGVSVGQDHPKVPRKSSK